MNCRKNVIIASTLLLVFISCNFAVAETARRDEGGEAASRVQNLLRQVSAERDAMATENAKLGEKIRSQEAEIEKLKKSKDRLEKKLEISSQRADKYKDGNDKLRERVLDSRDKMQKIIAKYRELITSLRGLEKESNQLKQEVSSKNKQLNVCVSDNTKLYDVNIEVLGLYKNKGVWDAFLQEEPVTQLKRVEIESIGEEYRAKLNDLKVVSTEVNQNE